MLSLWNGNDAAHTVTVNLGTAAGDHMLSSSVGLAIPRFWLAEPNT
jgi:hypothetical protein